MAASLDSVIVSTPHMTELAAWYREVLELGEWEQYPGHLGQRVGTVWFGLDEVGVATPGSRTVAWFRVDDLQATFERATATGAEVISPPTQKAFGYELASVKDPDGNPVGLAQARAAAS